MNTKSVLKFFALLVPLTIIFLVFFIGGAMLFPPELPQNAQTEPGPIPTPFDILVVGLGHTLPLMLLLWNARLYGWKLYAASAFTYYGLVTFMSQIETAFFLTSLTVSQAALVNLFLMGLPPALLFIPVAMLILGKWKRPVNEEPMQPFQFSIHQWVWKLAIIAFAYLVLYFGAGYFIAWQNPELRAFYHGEDPGSFFLQMANIFRNDPSLPPFQVLRALLWTLFALPAIRMTRGKPWQVALIVGLLISVPMNIGHLMPNPLIPFNSVRISHMIETSSSNFVFGLILAWLLHRSHTSLADLFGLRRTETKPAPAAV